MLGPLGPPPIWELYSTSLVRHQALRLPCAQACRFDRLHPLQHQKSGITTFYHTTTNLPPPCAPTHLCTLRTGRAAIVLCTWKGGYSIPLACTGLHRAYGCAFNWTINRCDRAGFDRSEATEVAHRALGGTCRRARVCARCMRPWLT